MQHSCQTCAPQKIHLSEQCLDFDPRLPPYSADFGRVLPGEVDVHTGYGGHAPKKNQRRQPLIGIRVPLNPVNMTDFAGCEELISALITFKPISGSRCLYFDYVSVIVDDSGNTVPARS